MPKGIKRGRGSTGPATETVVASAARTTNGNTAALPGWGGQQGLAVRLNITARSGTTPTLQLIIEHSDDGTSWTALDTFPTQNNPTPPVTVDRAVTSTAKPYVRARWVLGGTSPSFTFSVKFARSLDQINF